MRFLLDTRLLLCAAAKVGLSRKTVALLSAPDHELLFSAVSLVALSAQPRLGDMELLVDTATFRSELLASRYREIVFTGVHAAGVARVPPAGFDLFARMLIAQAVLEGVTLLTDDPIMAAYPGPVRSVP